MPEEIITRMCSGERIKMSRSEIREELDAGVIDAAQKGEISELPTEDIVQLFEIIAEPGRFKEQMNWAAGGDEDRRSSK